MIDSNKDMNKTKPKIGLALGSGGAKGFAHIGVLRALEKMGIKPDIITGSSMGAIVGACYALGVSVNAMAKTVTELSTKKLLDVKLPNNYGFVKGDRANNLIREFLNVEEGKELSFNDCKIPFGCVAANLSEPEVVYLTEGDLLKSVRASYSINGVFQAVEINGKKLTDGGILCRVPVTLAREMGADVVIAVDCVGKTQPVNLETNKYIDTIVRIFSIMDYEISKHEMSTADCLISINQPEVSIIRIKNVEEGILAGYNAAKNKENEIKKLIQNWK